MNRIVITTDVDAGRISRHIYGHFAEHLGRCIYDGLWVGEDSKIPNVRGIRSDIVEALKKIRIPNLRWPGGCFADDYNWMDGIGPREQRPKLVNHHWGRVVEDNAFGTHEFMDLCAQLETEPYICGNVGTGSVRQMQQWVEYITSPEGPMADQRAANGRPDPWKVRMWGVGNENWACGGYMRPEYYADLFRNHVAFLRNLGDNRLYKIACGPYGEDLHWTEVLMRETQPRKLMHALAMHFYCGSGREKQLAIEGGEDDWYFLLNTANRMDALLKAQIAVMDRYDPDDRVGMLVDEWGTWHLVESGTNEGFLYQQNTMRDAVAASLTLNIFNRHCRRVHGTNIAQTVNVLQAMVLTEGDHMLLTPTYHVFDMYSAHHDAVCLPCHVDAGQLGAGDTQVPGLSASASRADDGSVHVTMTNLSATDSSTVAVSLHGLDTPSLQGRLLSGSAMNSHNSFDAPTTVRPVDFDDLTVTAHGFDVELPARSVVAVTAR
ncbi:MAG TPA: alpha-N-arabinofuranosidase [Candidatus Latescibacteria bacterium]|jgi:alpha-N-arabinofuranosidase|nr:alpha-N-arabinofuranosidase [Candidatus Latescibacterota bacterium]